jgi:hypothetical protein
MPLFMDIHRLDGATPEAVAKAHLEDLKAQEKYRVSLQRFEGRIRQGP